MEILSGIERIEVLSLIHSDGIPILNAYNLV